MAIIMGKGCIEAIYGLMGWKGLIITPPPPQKKKKKKKKKN